MKNIVIKRKNYILFGVLILVLAMPYLGEAASEVRVVGRVVDEQGRVVGGIWQNSAVRNCGSQWPSSSQLNVYPTGGWDCNNDEVTGSNTPYYYTSLLGVGTKTITLTPPSGYQCDIWQTGYQDGTSGPQGSGCSATTYVSGDLQTHVWFYIKKSSSGNASPGSAPSVTTNSATNTAQNSTTLNGSVNPNSASTNVWFEYGTTQSLGYSVGNQSIGSGSSAVSTSYSLSGLSSNTTYYFKAVASNSYGTTYGSILSFTTSQSSSGSAPSVTTNSASGIYQNSATLNGSVNPNSSYTNAWFEYGTSMSLGYTAGNQSIGSGNSSVNISYSLSNLQQNATYYFRAVASNSYGTNYGTIFTFVTSGGTASAAPSVYTNPASSIYQNSAVLNGSVNPNGSYTNAWFEYGTNQSLGYTVGSQSVGTGNYPTNFSISLSNLIPNTVYYYRAVASNSYGTSYGTILSFNTTTGSPTTGSAPIVITSPALYVYQNSALLSGSVNPNGYLTNAWFEWGALSSLGRITTFQSMGSGNTSLNYSYNLSGLVAGATYYYRAVAQNSYGTGYGTILTFTTPGSTYPSPTPTPTPTPAPTQNIELSVSPLSLDIIEPRAGEEVNLMIIYRNPNSKPITNVMLRVILPNEVEYISSNPNVSSRDGNVLTFNIGGVKANAQDAINVRIKIKESVKAGTTMVFSVILEYTDPNGNSQSVSANLTAIVKEDLSFLALSLGSIAGLFKKWWFDLLLGLAIGLAIYHFFIKKEEPELAA